MVNSRGFCIAVSFTTRDTLGLVLGGTTASPEFAPILSTGVVGDVFAEALFFAVVGNPGENLWSSSALPNSSIFFDPARIDATVISVALTGPNLTSPLVLEGNASRLDVSGPTPIPEPGTFLLVGIATASFGNALRLQHIARIRQMPVKPEIAPGQQLGGVHDLARVLREVLHHVIDGFEYGDVVLLHRDAFL